MNVLNTNVSKSNGLREKKRRNQRLNGQPKSKWTPEPKASPKPGPTTTDERLTWKDIAGLYYIPNFLSKDEAVKLSKDIDAQEWNTQISRRTIHYGCQFDYYTQEVHQTNPMPDYLQFVLDRLHAHEGVPYSFDQAIINEYRPGQGIAAHVDHTKHFDRVVASLSLCSVAFMWFSNPKTGQVIPVPLEPGSMAILTGPARYEWKHQIRKNKIEVGAGMRIVRKRRVSVTFRRMLHKGTTQ